MIESEQVESPFERNLTSLDNIFQVIGILRHSIVIGNSKITNEAPFESLYKEDVFTKRNMAFHKGIAE